MRSLPRGHKNWAWPSTVCKAPHSWFGTSTCTGHFAVTHTASEGHQARTALLLAWDETKRKLGEAEPHRQQGEDPPTPAFCPRLAQSAATEVPVTPFALVRACFAMKTAQRGSPATPRVSSQ